MTELKNLCAKIDIEVHKKVREEQEKSGVTLNQYVEMLIKEYYKLKEEEKHMSKGVRTLAVQIDEELFERIKIHLQKTGMKQKEFIISLIESALEEIGLEEIMEEVETIEVKGEGETE